MLLSCKYARVASPSYRLKGANQTKDDVMLRLVTCNGVAGPRGSFVFMSFFQTLKPCGWRVLSSDVSIEITTRGTLREIPETWKQTDAFLISYEQLC